MLKRITTSNLRIGMHIEEFCGSWMDHPFWRAKFVVKDFEQLARIRDSGVTEVWIDSERGLDVDEGQAESRTGSDAKVERRLRDVAATAKTQTSSHERAEAELTRASKIFRESRSVVADMFGEARLGELRNLDQASDVVGRIAESVARHSTAMIGLARLKSTDDYTFMHSMAVSALMIALARTLELDAEHVRLAGMAGLLHDVGKAHIPLNVLNKPGTLTDGEWETMRAHPERGVAMLHSTEGITPDVLDAVLHHHEKMDGTGYPHRLNGPEIALLARMSAICDVYDAITSDRAYKAGWQPTIAIRKMTEWADGHFDPGMFQAFVRTIGIYPIGSLVRLKSDRLAVVVDHDPSHLLKPTVRAFFSLKSKMHVEPVLINLAQSSQDRIIGVEDAATHGLSHIDDMWLPVPAAI